MINAKGIVYKYNKLIRYFSFSVFVTFIDFFIVWILMKFFGLSIVFANTIGVIIGFIIHYILSSKSVFDTKYGIKGFIAYLGTFLIGLILADLLIYISYKYFMYFFGNYTSLMLSKGVSILAPFFIMYFLRKLIYRVMNKYYNRKYCQLGAGKRGE